MKQKTNSNIHRPLVITGYSAFAVLVGATLLSTTIPYLNILSQPNSIKINAATAMIALTVGIVLPLLVGYFIGDYSIKSKSRLSHHFNGMLFGLLAFWLMTIFAIVVSFPRDFFADFNSRMIFMNTVPSIAIAVIVTIVAIAHLRSRQATQDILDYKPFSLSLIVALILMPVWTLINEVIAGTINGYSFTVIGLMLIIGAVVYASLRKTKFSSYKKVVWAAISLSVLYVILFVSNQLIFSVASYILPTPTAEAQGVVSIVSAVVGLSAWVVYWVVQARALTRSKLK